VRNLLPEERKPQVRNRRKATGIMIEYEEEFPTANEFKVEESNPLRAYSAIKVISERTRPRSKDTRI